MRISIGLSLGIFSWWFLYGALQADSGRFFQEVVVPVSNFTRDGLALQPDQITHD